ncbi:hypothetical protein PQX77_011733 [Marasmius sp. AFHP31]|nr:hypothetical protein PQX77_011733 [Marasmius sp. AFHP31]
MVEVDGKPYFIQDPGELDGTPRQKHGTVDYLLVTSVPSPAQGQPLSATFLAEVLQEFEEIDDVWEPGFLQGLALSTTLFDDSLPQWLRERGVAHLFVPDSFEIDPRLRDFEVVHSSKALPAGPYVYSRSTHSFHNIYRLFPDLYESFMCGCIPRPHNGGPAWIPTNFTLPTQFRSDDGNEVYYHQYIPVPSRLHHVPFSLEGRPLRPSPNSLAGKRMAVKDIFDMRGLPTSAGSKAFLEMTGPSSPTTAHSLENLLSMGILPIGKTRTSQFAHGASPWEFLDFGYSWNPRGDGMLTVVASSSGSASAIAGYEWLDLTVGSDTRGSVRKPASMIGVYGIRPTLGSASLEGVVPLSVEMDTAGLFLRDPWSFHSVVKEFYRGSPVTRGEHFSRLPSRLLYPTDHFPAQSPEAQSLYDTFLGALAELNITKHPINLTQALSPLFPDQQFSQFQSFSNRLTEYNSWNQVGKPLTEWYQQRYGHAPRLDPMPNIMFVRGEQHSKEAYLEAVAYKRGFASALEETLFEYDAESCSDSILVYDTGTGGRPSYRVEEFNSLEGATEVTLVKAKKNATLPENLHYLASMGGLVDVTVPLGEVEYFSAVSRRWEPMPVTIQLATRGGCDAVIMDLIRILAEKGVLRSVKTGRSLYWDEWEDVKDRSPRRLSDSR